MIAVALISTLLLLLTVNYCLLIFNFIKGLKNLQQLPHATNRLRKVTIIISARNEEDNIEDCLTSLLAQDYPKEFFEVLVIDDQSTDNTAYVISEFIRTHTFNCRMLKTNARGGKKLAFILGLKEATGELILTTDADCITPPQWIRAMNRCFDVTNAVFVAGPVMMHPCKSWFQKFQCLEFNALIASTAGSFGINRPLMSNGANMGILAQACREEMVKLNTVSGDDVFTMFYLKQKYGRKRLTFLNSPDSVVLTKTTDSFKDFIQQRIRWTSKSTSYTDRDVIYTALSVMCVNMLLLIAIAGSLVPSAGQNSIILRMVTMVSLILKTIFDYSLLVKYSGLFGQKDLIKYLPLAEIPVLIYTTLTGLLGTILPYNWKGRKF